MLPKRAASETVFNPNLKETMSSKAKKRVRDARHEEAKAKGMVYVSRNDKCPCGSGKKAKRCCLNQIKAFAALPPQVREAILVNRILSPQVPPAVAAKFAAMQAAQAANPDDAAAAAAAGMAAEAQAEKQIEYQAGQQLVLDKFGLPTGIQIPVESADVGGIHCEGGFITVGEPTDAVNPTA